MIERILKPIRNAMDEFFRGTSRTTVRPHIVDYLDIKRYMSMVIIGLIPSVLASIYFWGPRVILMILTSYIAGGVVETIFAIVRKKEIHEGFLVTGLIFPMILPPDTPLWMVAAGVMFGVMFGKEVFGGTGKNIFNPAIVGRVFLSIAFADKLSTYWQEPLTYAVTSATPLILFKSQKIVTDVFSLLWGRTPGCIGETFRLGIILGGFFLIIARISNWRIPMAYLGSVMLFSLLGNKLWPGKFAPWMFQLFSGGLLFGAFFMATDPVTTPFTKGGKWVAGILLGILTVLIRGLSGYVEGVMFSILLMNAFTPLIDQIVLNIRYRKGG